ncbi:hypothetical protein BYT27DRAFT_7194953 [Phlegmacium glaucopus]|nr:hypothetical protein BYT27DRAFT_7194953 [Phlegmacium glaucopus]
MILPYVKPLVDHVNEEVPERFREIYPYPVSDRVTRNILVREFLIKEWAEHFVDMDEAALDAIAGSFKLERCLKWQELNTLLTQAALVRSM